MRVLLVQGLSLAEWEETHRVHDTDNCVFAKGFLPH
jgi:hypothetical protein